VVARVVRHRLVRKVVRDFSLFVIGPAQRQPIVVVTTATAAWCIHGASSLSVERCEK
jgi:hypothetical protein